MFRFTIRDVLWLTVVVAMGCGWCVEHRQLAAVRDVLHTQDAKNRIVELRERELRGGVILTPTPKRAIPGFDRDDRELPRAKDE